ncbi:MAG: tRNA dihydrouridine synthase DusB [Lentimicrobiaceae bacterium]|jgi:nifR3 family TIM-barrel protein|nr:tRNA dihydrouridine synthase DusB [Lentimicrobiaceae bacterium]
MIAIGNLIFSEKPVMLAPMEDITDPAFRLICRKMGANMVFSEFISSEGLIRDAVKSTRKLLFSEEERPVGIQIFGHDASSMQRAAEMAAEAQPDLIDINFGCPVKKVVSKGGGAGLLNNLPEMVKITRTVVDSVSIPVSVKTRLGWDDKNKNIVEIAEQLQDCGIRSITIHGRTKSQMYRGEADWTLIGEVKKNPRMKIPVIGNGDITHPQKALEMMERHGVDGIMIGRAAIGNPWIFRDIKAFLSTRNLLPAPSLQEKVEVCKQHLAGAVEYKGEKRAVFEMRKHYANYFKSIPDFKSKRLQLMSLSDADSIFRFLDAIACA